MANFVASQHFSQIARHAEDGHPCGLTMFLTHFAPRRGWPTLWSHNISHKLRATQRMVTSVASQHFLHNARHAEDDHPCGLTMFLTHFAPRRGWPTLWSHNISHKLRATQRMVTSVASHFSHIARHAEDGHLCGLTTFLTHCAPRRGWPPLWPHNDSHILRATQRMATFVALHRFSHIAYHAEDGHLCGLTTFLTYCAPRRWPPLWPHNVTPILPPTNTNRRTSYTFRIEKATQQLTCDIVSISLTALRSDFDQIRPWDLQENFVRGIYVPVTLAETNLTAVYHTDTVLRIH